MLLYFCFLAQLWIVEASGKILRNLHIRPTLSNVQTSAAIQAKPPAKNKSTRKQANQNLKQTTCLSHNNYWIMQILTKQTKQGASISGKKSQQREGSDWKSDLLFLLLCSHWEKVDQDWHLLASLMGCTYWSQSLAEQNTLVGWFCITGFGRRQWLGRGLAGGLLATRFISGRLSSQE